MLSQPVIVFLIAWLLLAMVADFPTGGPTPFRQILRLIIEIVALILIAFGPYLTDHLR